MSEITRKRNQKDKSQGREKMAGADSEFFFVILYFEKNFMFLRFRFVNGLVTK